MLFDLRGRGRRRTVQVIYLGLALIFLLGFVGFGVGVGGGGGGLFNALTENNGSSSASFTAKVAAAQKHVKREPNNPQAWLALTEAQLHQSTEEAYSNPTTGQFTSKGKQLLAQVSHSWNTYLTLQAHNPNSTLAQRMLTVYGEEGLNQAADEVAALQIVIPTKPPSAALYATLAEYSYKAHNPGQGDLAAAKAVSLAPSGERKRIKAYLEAIKKNPSESAASAASSAVPSGTYTATVGGKKTVLKSSGGGTLTSVPATTPAKTSSTKK
ncbi:MAG TPA: hypothetical protein VK756_02175 [Solirubrobacteraceae bacterium]|jgi:hypothetical protein|nr:hypothetical protein [Solirubrobacteraceae bacterium]